MKLKLSILTALVISQSICTFSFAGNAYFWYQSNPTAVNGTVKYANSTCSCETAVEVPVSYNGATSSSYSYSNTSSPFYGCNVEGDTCQSSKTASISMTVACPNGSPISGVNVSCGVDPSEISGSLISNSDGTYQYKISGKAYKNDYPGTVAVNKIVCGQSTQSSTVTLNIANTCDQN